MPRGFTLIETIIYMAIIGLVVSSFVGFSVTVSRARNKSYASEEVQANARMALDLISQRIRAASSVNTGTSTFNSDPGVLSLAMADAAKNPTIIDLTADDGVLRITEGVNSPVSVTSGRVRVTNLVFTNLTGSGARENIRVQMTVGYASTAGDTEFSFSKSFQTTVSVRE